MKLEMENKSKTRYDCKANDDDDDDDEETHENCQATVILKLLVNIINNRMGKDSRNLRKTSNEQSHTHIMKMKTNT